MVNLKSILIDYIIKFTIDLKKVLTRIKNYVMMVTSREGKK